MKTKPGGQWMDILASAVAKLFSVGHFYARRSGFRFIFYGRADLVEDACATFEKFANRAIWICRDEQNAQDLSYLHGLAVGFSNAVAKETEDLSAYHKQLQDNAFELLGPIDLRDSRKSQHALNKSKVAAGRIKASTESVSKKQRTLDL
jgi:hypothetical protein